LINSGRKVSWRWISAVVAMSKILRRLNCFGRDPASAGWTNLPFAELVLN